MASQAQIAESFGKGGTTITEHSPTFDALFDKHMISFENNGKILLSDDIS